MTITGHFYRATLCYNALMPCTLPSSQRRVIAQGLCFSDAKDHAGISQLLCQPHSQAPSLPAVAPNANGDFPTDVWLSKKTRNIWAIITTKG